MSLIPRVQIVHLATGITTLRRAVRKEELRWGLELALLKGALDGVPYGMRPRITGLIVARVLDHLAANGMEVYVRLPSPRRERSTDEPTDEGRMTET